MQDGNGAAGDCRADDASRAEQEALAREQVRERMSRVKHKLLVLSGKGGVGKSTVAVNLALGLVLSGFRVGLVDIDIHGPSIPTMLGLQNEKPLSEGGTIVPVSMGENFKVMSIGFFLRSDRDAVIWRGPLKFSAIRQFLKDVEWGDLDYLIVDSPPGTGDEPLSICQLLPGIDGAVVVTTPQDVSVVDVRRCITFCKELKVPVLGIIENMAGLECPHCGEHIDVFKAGGGGKLSREAGVPLLGSIPIDPRIVHASDSGASFMQRHADSPAAKVFGAVVDKILDGVEGKRSTPEKRVEGSLQVFPERAEARLPHTISYSSKDKRMRIGIPTAGGKLCMHFGHCEKFALVDVEDDKIIGTNFAEPPEHQPGVYPRWLSGEGVKLVIVSGMGQRAISLFEQAGVKVLVGAPTLEPEEVVRQYLAGTLQAGGNICDH